MRHALVAGFPQQVPIACVGHPAGTSKVAVMDMPGAVRLTDRVDAEQHSNGLLPVGAVCRCIEQPHVELDMRFVVVGQFLTGRRTILERVDHGFAPSFNLGSTRQQQFKENAPQPENLFLASTRDSRSDFLFVASIIDEKHSLSAVCGQKNDAGCFQRPANLIARGLIHLEIACRFEAFQRGQ